MNRYPSNYAVTVTINFVDLNGNAVTPNDVTAILYNGDDEEIVDFGSLPFSGTSKDIVVPAAFNILAGEDIEARILRVVLETDDGDIRYTSSYLIQGENRLILMSNSFMSLEAAEILTLEMANLSRWTNATNEQKYVALTNSYNKLTRISMHFTPQDDTGDYMLFLGVHSTETVVPASAWRTVTETEFLAWPVYFKKILRLAQLAEANSLLEGDAYSIRRQNGIVSETIGETSVTLDSGQIDLGIDTRALKYLSGHIHYDFRIKR